MVDQVLAETGHSLVQLDAIAFGEGPGSFTGLRIAVGVTQGLAFGADVPVVPVSSLLAQAQRVEHESVLAAFDARMNELYWCSYEMDSHGSLRPQHDVALGPASSVVLSPDRSWVAAGTGADRYLDQICESNSGVTVELLPQSFPHAADVALAGRRLLEAGGGMDARDARPRYVRDRVTG